MCEKAGMVTELVFQEGRYPPTRASENQLLRFDFFLVFGVWILVGVHRLVFFGLDLRHLFFFFNQTPTV
jgi:hypothetical protein